MKVKICGITNIQDAKKACELGAWGVGFIFYPKSPRYLSFEKAQEIISQLPQAPAKIGVFVNEERTAIEKAELIGLTHLQFHGNETPEACQGFTLPVIKSFPLKEEKDLENLTSYKNLFAYLIESPTTGEALGGTGQLSNWELAKKAKQDGNTFLAGGISSQNIAQAMKEVSPFAFDLSSSVEKSPGIKDHKKLEELFQVVKEMNNV